MGKYYRSSAIYPNECIFFMEHDFKALSLESRGKLPNYREWLFSTDLTSAYTYHKRFLQLHQADAPGFWNLKMPSHILYLDYLLKVYPDARLVWAHRDPLTALGSFCSILTLGAKSFTGTADLEYIGQNCLNQELLHIERGLAALDRYGDDRFTQVHYADLTPDRHDARALRGSRRRVHAPGRGGNAPVDRRQPAGQVRQARVQARCLWARCGRAEAEVRAIYFALRHRGRGLSDRLMAAATSRPQGGF
jgi:hypothetical protein